MSWPTNVELLSGDFPHCPNSHLGVHNSSLDELSLIIILPENNGSRTLTPINFSVSAKEIAIKLRLDLYT